jgi:hypothetical protein
MYAHDYTCIYNIFIYITSVLYTYIYIHISLHIYAVYIFIYNIYICVCDPHINVYKRRFLFAHASLCASTCALPVVQ